MFLFVSHFYYLQINFKMQLKYNIIRIQKKANIQESAQMYVIRRCRYCEFIGYIFFGRSPLWLPQNY